MRQVTLSDEEMGIQAYWRHGFFFWFASSGAFLAFVYLLTDAICKQNTISTFYSKTTFCKSLSRHSHDFYTYNTM
jgi:hypothetical protein